MKTITITVIAIIISVAALAKGQVVTVDVVLINSLHSAHVNQCSPTCANQDNGGIGMILSYDIKKLHIGFGRIDLVNSYGDNGYVWIFEPAKAGFNFGWISGSVAAWFMEIHGYKDSNGDPIVQHVDAWPKFALGVNPVYYWIENVSLNYNVLPTIYVTIDWWSVSYYHEIEDDKVIITASKSGGEFKLNFGYQFK